MKKIYCIIFLLLYCHYSFNQIQFIKGKTIGSNTENPLQFVNIGVVNTTYGTVSDIEGNFILYYDPDIVKKTDSIRFSMIGYCSKSLPVEHFLENKNTDKRWIIDLNEKIVEIAEVSIIESKIKNRKLGNFHRSLLNMYVNFSISKYENQNLGSEIGRRFNISNNNTLLDTFKFFISYNNYDTCKFRINVYSIKNGMLVNILNKNIFCDIYNKKTGWINVNLSPFNIRVNEDIVITVQWVAKSKQGNTLSLPIYMPVTGIHYYKYGSQNKWKTFYSMSSKMALYIKY